MTAQASEKLANKINKSGAHAVPYKRRVLRGAGFFLTRTRDAKAIRLWLEEKDADVSMAISKAHQQAVLNVQEDEREIQQSLGMYLAVGGRLSRATLLESPDRLRRAILEQAEGTHPFVGVDDDKVTVGISDRSLALVRQEIESNHESYYPVYPMVRYTASLPKSDSSFLVGIDETAHFVAMLPEKAATVKEAHELLKPKTLGKGWVRQGEWFFQPVDKDLNMELSEHFLSTHANQSLRGMKSSLEFGDNGEGSTHMAPKIIYKGRTYARGLVEDIVRGKHKTLELPTWHEVLRNREVAVPLSMQTRAVFD